MTRRRWTALALFVLAGVALVLSWTLPSRPTPRPIYDWDVKLAAEYVRMQMPGSFADLSDSAVVAVFVTKYRRRDGFDSVVRDLSARLLQDARALTMPPPEPESPPDWRRPSLAGVWFVGLVGALFLALPDKRRRLLTGEELEKRAKELGVDVQGDPVRGTIANVREVRASDADLQRRVMDAERSVRESRLWWIAFVSVLAALASAVAAWVAISR